MGDSLGYGRGRFLGIREKIPIERHMEGVKMNFNCSDNGRINFNLWYLLQHYDRELWGENAEEEIITYYEFLKTNYPEDILTPSMIESMRGIDLSFESLKHLKWRKYEDFMKNSYTNRLKRKYLKSNGDEDNGNKRDSK